MRFPLQGAALVETSHISLGDCFAAMQILTSGGGRGGRLTRSRLDQPNQFPNSVLPQAVTRPRLVHYTKTPRFPSSAAFLKFRFERGIGRSHSRADLGRALTGAILGRVLADAVLDRPPMRGCSRSSRMACGSFGERARQAAERGARQGAYEAKSATEGADRRARGSFGSSP